MPDDMPANDPKKSPEDANHEVFIALFAHHEPELRRFVRSLMPTAVDADEVLQQTAIVIWRKFDQYDPQTQFMKWACVIARFEALAYRRKMARDRLVFTEELMDLMADEGVVELDSRQSEREVLDECLAAMPEQQRRFLTLAYTPGIKTKELAEAAGSTAAAFYMRLKRLRGQLMECVESKLEPTGYSS